MKAVEYGLGQIYTALGGSGDVSHKSREYQLGLIYDLLYGTNYSPLGGRKSEEWWLKQIRVKVLTDYGIDIISTHAPEATLADLLAAIEAYSVPVTPTVSLISNNPYATAGAQRVLTQLHCHTDNSDGASTPAAVDGFYNGVSYGALAITDHNYATPDPGGVAIYIAGDEITPDNDSHILTLDGTYLPTDKPTDHQAAIDDIVAGGGFAIICHPDSASYGMGLDELSGLTGYTAQEVHYGLTAATPDSTVKWDAILSAVSSRIWGSGSDDYHLSDLGHDYDMGANIVMASAATKAAVVSAFKNGAHVIRVGATGITYGIPVVDGNNISLSCPGAYQIRFIGHDGLVLKTVTGETADYDCDGTEFYVRPEVIGSYTETFGAALSHRWRVNSGTWAVGSGIYQQTNDGISGGLSTHRLVVSGDIDATFDVRIPTQASPGAGRFVWCLNALTDYYQIGVSAASQELSLQKRIANVASVIQAAAKTISADTWYRVRVQWVQATGAMQARIWEPAGAEPGTWDVSGTDTTLKYGVTGLRCDGAVDFDNLVITGGYKAFYNPIEITPVSPVTLLAHADTRLNGTASSVDRNYGLTAPLNIGQGGTGSYRGLFGGFNVSAIPAGKTISNAKLWLYCESEYNTTDRSFAVHQALTRWYEGDKDNAALVAYFGSTWNHREGIANLHWGAVGGLAGTDYTAAAAATTSVTGTGWFSWDITAIVQAWYANPATNLGLWLIGDETVANTYKGFTARNGAVVANRPKIVATFA